MARCKLTRMNLRNIRKTKEYQVLLIDLVATGVIRQDAAEGILGYTIPAGLLGSTTPADDDDDNEEEGTDTEGSGTEGSGTEGSGGESDNTVTLLYFDAAANDGAGEWKTAEYDLTDDATGSGILDFAKTEFNNASIGSFVVAEENTEYVEGEDVLYNKYIELGTQPEALEAGMLIIVDTVLAPGNGEE